MGLLELLDRSYRAYFGFIFRCCAIVVIALLAYAAFFIASFDLYEHLIPWLMSLPKSLSWAQTALGAG